MLLLMGLWFVEFSLAIASVLLFRFALSKEKKDIFLIILGILSGLIFVFVILRYDLNILAISKSALLVHLYSGTFIRNKYRYWMRNQLIFIKVICFTIIGFSVVIYISNFNVTNPKTNRDEIVEYEYINKSDVEYVTSDKKIFYYEIVEKDNEQVFKITLIEGLDLEGKIEIYIEKDIICLGDIGDNKIPKFTITTKHYDSYNINENPPKINKKNFYEKIEYKLDILYK